jgi:RNA polymerase sigma-70 factor (ECF subfamily)
MEDDIGLVERYIAGDKDAIEELVIRYQKMVYSIIYRMINDMEEAKDLTQKTFIKAVNGIRGFRKDSSFKTWLYQIAINTSLNHLRKNRYEEVELDESISANNPGTLSSIIEKEKKEHIKKSLDMLPERQRLAIVLRVYEDLSCSDTAKIMGCSEGAVKAHYHHGVNKLRGILKEKGYETGP